MDPRDFLAVAERFKASPSEAERRTSVGRSYCGLFNVIITALASRGVVFRQIPEDHYTLVSYLAKSGHRTAASVGAVLKDLRGERNRADYDMRAAVDLNASRFMHRKATTALAQFDGIPPDEWAVIVQRIQALP